MRPITYDLRCDSHDASTFNLRARTLASTVVREGGRLLGHVLNPAVECTAEQVFELLTLGTLWRVYGSDARRAGRFEIRCASWLASLRQRGGRTKAWADVARGWLFTWLGFVRYRSEPTQGAPSLAELGALTRWLAATGEYREEVVRLRQWERRLAALPHEQRTGIIHAVAELAEWFDGTALKELGRYTTRVEEFLERCSRRYRYREDGVSCAKARVEYHLGMVGACILNESFRPAFESCREWVLLVPGCMRHLAPEHCRAEVTRRGSKCTQCAPACRVNELTRLGRDHGFEVMMLHHASDLSVWAPEPGETATGVVGVACVPQLVGGGWKLQSLGIPAQCVMLDGCGCRAHWHETGLPTTLCTPEVLRILQRPSSRRRAA